MAQCVFYIAGLTAAFFAGFMVFQRSLYMSALCLLAVLFQAAVLFYVIGAPMLAFLQIMIYAGAVMVLIVVTIMASQAAPAQTRGRLFLPGPVIWLGLLAPVLELGLILVETGVQGGALGCALAVQGRIGAVLFGPYAAATEAVTFLMFLAALAVVSARKTEGEAL